MLYLTQSDIISLNVGMTQIIDAVEEGFRRKGLGQTQMPPQIAIYFRGDKTSLYANSY